MKIKRKRPCKRKVFGEKLYKKDKTFRKKKRAEKYAKRLRWKGYSVRVSPNKNKSGKNEYEVYKYKYK